MLTKLLAFNDGSWQSATQRAVRRRLHCQALTLAISGLVKLVNQIDNLKVLNDFY